MPESRKPRKLDLHKLQLRFPQDERAVLSRQREQTGLPVATLIRKALAAYLGEPLFNRDLKSLATPGARRR
jgi:hypothetical protein